VTALTPLSSGDARSAARPLVGTAAVVLMLATTRWGSYIGASPLFLTDLLVAGAVVRMLFTMGGTPQERQPGFTSPPGLLVLFLGYVGFRMLFSGQYVLTQTWLRDGVPYLYGVLGLLSAASVTRATPESRARTMTWLWRALVFHLAWMAGVGLVGSVTSLQSPLPFLGEGLFTVRPDIDSAILGVTGGLLVRRLLTGQTRVWSVIGLGVVVATMTTEATRAGFIALLACAVVAFAYSYAATHDRLMRRAGILLAIPLVVAAVVQVVPATQAGARLLATVEPSSATTAEQEGAIGTSHARRLVWHGVIDWTLTTQSRSVFGTGMGPDFLTESDTVQYLEGTTYENVRSPHDYFVGSFARLGFIGLGLLLVLVLRTLWQMVRHRRRIGEDELLTCVSLIAVGILVVASFGVVLEAPFGAVPFWWSVGILLALTRMPAVEAGEVAEALTPSASRPAG
jgi:O-antigen ligase